MKILTTNTQNGDDVLIQSSADGGDNNSNPITDISKLLMSGFRTSKSGGGSGGAAYETVLVILQDLSAMELEEAFDHVDIVCKTADTATVRIDGQVSAATSGSNDKSGNNIDIERLATNPRLNINRNSILQKV